MHSKLIATAGGCLGFGALIGWALTADRYERRMKSNQEILSDIIARQHNEILRLTSMLPYNNGPVASEDELITVAPIESVEADSENSPEENLVETDESPDDILRGETEEETRSNLRALIQEYTNNPDDVDVFVNRGERTLDVDYTPPFVVSRELYAHDPDEGDEYDKITLTYYPKLRLLLDDEDEPLDDIEHYVGWRNLKQFGGESGDPNVVFVRNRTLLTDFEVVQEPDDDPPIHVRYGMSKAEFESNKAAGVIKFRPGDE